MSRIRPAVPAAELLACGAVGDSPGGDGSGGECVAELGQAGGGAVGLFNVSVQHNIVHLLFGVGGLALARAASSAHLFLLGGGVIYLLL